MNHPWLLGYLLGGGAWFTYALSKIGQLWEDVPLSSEETGRRLYILYVSFFLSGLGGAAIWPLSALTVLVIHVTEPKEEL